MMTKDANMGISKSAFTSLFLTVFLDSLGFMMVFSYLYFFAASLGATPLVYGTLLAVYAVMQLIFAPALGRISDRFGRRRVLIISTFGTGLSLLVFGLANSIATLFVARAISGMMGATFPVAQAYVSDATDQKSRLRYMGFLGAGLGLGLAVGPAVGGVLSDAFGYAMPSLFGAVLGFANCAMTYLRLPETQRNNDNAKPETSLGALLSRSGMKTILGTYFVFFLAFLVMTTTYSPWASDRLGFGPMQVGLSLFYIGTLLVVVQGAFVPKMSAKFSPWVLMAAGLASFLVGLVTLAFTVGIQGLAVADTMLALGYGLAVPSFGTVISTIAAAESRGTAFGVAQSLQGGAQVVSPILGNSVLALGLGLGFDGLSFIASFGIVLPSLMVMAVLARGNTLRVPATSGSR